MKYRLTVGMLLVLAALAGCAGLGARPGELALVDFGSGRPVHNVAVHHTPDGLELSFPAVGPDGAFLHLELPPDQALSASDWSESAGLLQLVAPLSDGADIGVVPLPGWRPRPLALRLRLAPAARRASAPPIGGANALFDLALEQGGAGQVRLTWTEVNRGDYDFNGVVNVADLTPLAQHFKETYDAAAGDPRLSQLYWIDGDGNAEINIADISVIAQHYRSEIAGYSILRNGVAVPAGDGSLPTVLRGAAQFRPEEHLPPRYLAVADGSLVDDWSVVPVDVGGTAGTGGGVQPQPVELSVKFASAGLALYNQAGTDSAPDAAGHSLLRMVRVDDIMRRIDPIEDVDAAELGTAFGATTGSAGFNGLPRDEWLLLQVALAPTVDPATGQPWAGASVGTAPTHYRCLHVPVKLPAGDNAAQLTLSANFVKQQGGAYRVYISSDLRAGALRLKTYSELDYAGALVAADTDGDKGFEGELHLSDPRLCGLSKPRMQQLLADNEHSAGTRQGALATGSFAELVEPDGLVVADNVMLALGGGPGSPQGTTGLFMTEYTAVNEDVISASGTLRHEIAPSALLPGDALRLSGYQLDTPGHGASLWITEVTRIVDTSKPDKLYAWPGQTSAFPGEQVTITVSSEQSASPFYRLSGVRVTFNNASYVFDSLNAGAPGGGRADADGIWALLGATSLNLPPESQVQEAVLPDGRKSLDFYVLPQDGAELDSATGELFNFKLSVLGDVTLGIQRLDGGGVKRSYYTDMAGGEHFWSDDFNSGAPMIEIKDPGSPG